MTAAPCTFEVRAKEPSKYFCWVGFDRSLHTYFVYVVARGASTAQGLRGRSNQIILWRGTKAGEITAVAEVKELIAEYVELPAAVEMALRTASGVGVENEDGVEAVAGK